MARASESFSGKTVVFTGGLAGMDRQAAAAEVERRGGKVEQHVTRSTDLLVVGSWPGSRLLRARSYGVRTVLDTEFLAMLGEAA